MESSAAAINREFWRAHRRLWKSSSYAREVERVITEEPDHSSNYFIRLEDTLAAACERTQARIAELKIPNPIGKELLQLQFNRPPESQKSEFLEWANHKMALEQELENWLLQELSYEQSSLDKFAVEIGSVEQFKQGLIKLEEMAIVMEAKLAEEIDRSKTLDQAKERLSGIGESLRLIQSLCMDSGATAAAGAILGTLVAVFAFR